MEQAGRTFYEVALSEVCHEAPEMVDAKQLSVQRDVVILQPLQEDPELAHIPPDGAWSPALSQAIETKALD